MWFIEYYLAGDPLPKTRLVETVCPTKAMESLNLGQDLMSLTMKYIQFEVTITD